MTPPSAKPEKRLLRISELASLTDVPPASIKFYIKEGLLPAPIKTSGRQRYFHEARPLWRVFFAPGSNRNAWRSGRPLR